MDRILCLSLLLLLTAAAAIGGSENNLTSAGLSWSTATEESDLAPPKDSDSDGGFSSLDSMLQWAISHSDPEKLKESADAQQRLSPSELQKRQLEIKEIMEKIKMPSVAELMKIAISDLNNVSTSLEDRHRALQELLELVEPIDSANDLNKLGGLFAVTRELNHSNPGIRTVAAWVLGKASQNNPIVQQQILELGVLSRLMNMVKSNSMEEANKALYAVSALIRNNLASQELFYAEAGGCLLQDILSNASLDVRLRRKAVLLLADLAEYQIENVDRDEPPFFNDQNLLKSVVDLTALTDLDLQEKDSHLTLLEGYLNNEGLFVFPQLGTSGTSASSTESITVSSHLPTVNSIDTVSSALNTVNPYTSSHHSYTLWHNRLGHAHSFAVTNVLKQCNIPFDNKQSSTLLCSLLYGQST